MPHRHQHASDPDALPDAPHALDLRAQLVDARHCEGIHLGRDDYVVARRDAGDADRCKSRRAVDDDVVVGVVLLGYGAEVGEHADDPLLLRGCSDVKCEQIDRRRGDIHASNLRLPHDIVVARDAAGEQVAQRRRRILRAEKARRVGLRVSVDHKHALVVLGRKDRRHVHSGDRLTDAAF